MDYMDVISAELDDANLEDVSLTSLYPFMSFDPDLAMPDVVRSFDSTTPVATETYWFPLEAFCASSRPSTPLPLKAEPDVPLLTPPPSTRKRKALVSPPSLSPKSKAPKQQTQSRPNTPLPPQTPLQASLHEGKKRICSEERINKIVGEEERTMECRKELEDLILEVYENLQSDGVNILLPDDIARKIHGMVHLHRACSKSGDVAEDGSLIACGPGCSHDVKMRNPEDDEQVPFIGEEEIFRVQRMIEEHMAKIDMEVTPMVEHALELATHVDEPAPVSSDDEDERVEMLETILESPTPMSPMSPVIPWTVKEPTLDTSSQYSIDEDLKEIQTLNNQFDEMFEFMQKEFPDMANPARYSPGLDATDVESCDGSIMDEAGSDLTPPGSPFQENEKLLEIAPRPKEVAHTMVKPAVVKKVQSALPTPRKKSLQSLPAPLKKSQASLPTPLKKTQTQLPTPLKKSLVKGALTPAPPSRAVRTLARPPASVPKPSLPPLVRTRKYSNASDTSDAATVVSKQDMAAKRREEKDKREMQAREEAQKLREQRRALAESKAEADKAARAAKVEMVKRRREEREKRVLLTTK
ncbi:Aste57867_11183 [Aphanomyces stellatus]|uniref:Aste57867_11183 protein n=1 Tax=Aphanomyces stellatus TaxID=120398 RepID=A0A485KU52_9STRA|nr:hypothetical protein As57867_011141 [Aphanomyces stellatus]VFT88050.1 Aste57867_11183 [Aphanomyces stellatus]